MGSQGSGINKDTCFTLNNIDNHAVCYSIDHVVTGGGNCTAQGPCYYREVCPTMKSAGTHAVAICLNDQGGAVMDVSYDVTATLRSQDHGHPPLVFDARGNGGGCNIPNDHRRSSIQNHGLYGDSGAE